MLKNQDSLSAPSPSQTASAASVGQARVTPDELANALAAIEARRQAEAAHLASTIPIDQAVTDLHLDSTSDEIWAEVQKQRVDAAALRLAKTERTEEVQKPIAAALPIVRARNWRSLIAPFLAVAILTGAGVIPGSFLSLFKKSHAPASRHHATTAAPIFRPLSQIPAGTEVYADDAALTAISQGKAAAKVRVSLIDSGNCWTLVKMNGHVYLRGYTARTATVQELEGKGLNVYNDDDSGELDGEHTFSATIRVDKIPLQHSGGDSEYSEVTIPDYHSDTSTAFNPWR